MGILSVKIGILAGLFGIIGLAGLALLLLSVIFLIIRVANFDSMLPALLCVLLSIGVTAAGLVLWPMPDFDAELAKAAERNAPEEDENTASGDEDPAQTEASTLAADGTAEGGEASGTEDQAGSGEGTPAPAASVSETVWVPVEGIMSGWHVGLTIPKEWEDICVIEKDDTGWWFYQKASMEDYGGLVGYLLFAESPVDMDSPEYDHMDGFRVVIEKEGGALVFGGPTDVQFNYEVPEIMDEYNRMQETIPAILDSIAFVRAS